MSRYAIQAMRDAAVAAAEQSAGNGLRGMMTVEGVTLREAVGWFGDQIGVRDATRLRPLNDDDQDDSATATGTAQSGEGCRYGGWMTPASRQLRRRS